MRSGARYFAVCAHGLPLTATHNAMQAQSIPVSTAWVPFVRAHTSIGSTAPALPRTPHSKVRRAPAALTWQASTHMALLVVLAAASAQHSHVVHRCGQVGVDGGELDLRARVSSMSTALWFRVPDIRSILTQLAQRHTVRRGGPTVHSWITGGLTMA